MYIQQSLECTIRIQTQAITGVLSHCMNMRCLRVLDVCWEAAVGHGVPACVPAMEHTCASKLCNSLHVAFTPTSHATYFYASEEAPSFMLYWHVLFFLLHTQQQLCEVFPRTAKKANTYGRLPSESGRSRVLHQNIPDPVCYNSGIAIIIMF